MTKKEQNEFDGFIKAKRQITASIDARIEILEEQRGDTSFVQRREAKIEQLEQIRNYIRNVVLYEVKSKTRKK